ncbi:MAG: hypothetical protein ABSE56_18875 [Bryobacteraceae bacterium]|jgi:hypothetical protein
MRKLIPLAALLVPLLAAQDQPQLIWEGQVDGISVLHVRGNRVQAEAREGLPVERQRFHFNQPLPESRQEVRLEVVEGRGRVHILEQPRLDNNYTLSVSIEDRQPGSSWYSLAFYWEPAPQMAPPRGRRESITWSGRVDGEAIVSCHGSVCEAEARRGDQVTSGRFRFSKPLPSREVTVTLEKTSGRGEVRLLEQPRESNGYRARVSIRDPQGGSSDYGFALNWSPHDRKDAGTEFAWRGVLWSGRVDGRIRVVIGGRAAMSQVIRGAPIVGERAEFARGLPALDNPNVVVKLLRGRGRVEIVEYPSRGNHYQLVFEIDGAGGADDYEIEVRW